jgi:hypothetical protein
MFAWTNDLIFRVWKWKVWANNCIFNSSENYLSKSKFKDPQKVILFKFSMCYYQKHPIVRHIDGHICWNSKRQLLFLVRWPRKPNSVFRMFILKQQHIDTYRYRYIYIYTHIYVAVSNRRSPGNFLFTVCSSCKQKFVVWPFVYKETNGTYPFSNELNG